MAEAIKLGGIHHTIPHIATANHTSGEVIKLADDRAAVVVGGLDATQLQSGKKIAVAVTGPFRITKDQSEVIALGAEVFWDISEQLPITGPGATGDYRVGPCIGGGANGQDFVEVDLNAPAGTETS